LFLAITGGAIRYQTTRTSAATWQSFMFREGRAVARERQGADLFAVGDLFD
jgi:hypothetical protein